MTETLKTVFLVDDDDSVRKSLGRSLKRHGYQVEVFESASAFLQSYRPERAGCLVLDVAMPEMSGIELQQVLKQRSWHVPIVFITGHGDIPTSVRAIKQGAVEFLEKPLRHEILCERIDEALSQDSVARSEREIENTIRANYNMLTRRERDVMALLVEGVADRSSKEIGRKLNISHRTVEEYRARIMIKMHAKSITHLADIARQCPL